MTRQPRPGERSVLRSLQALLPYADPDLIDAALDGPFRCRVAVDAVAAATDADRLVVTTPARADAVDFYRALGFETDRRLTSFYDDGTAALCLVRRE